MNIRTFTILAIHRKLAQFTSTTLFFTRLEGIKVSFGKWKFRALKLTFKRKPTLHLHI